VNLCTKIVTNLNSHIAVTNLNLRAVVIDHIMTPGRNNRLQTS
jgi:hypothetical protein